MSTLTAYSEIQERSEATPGLFNRIFSTLSDNIRTASEGPFTSASTDTLSFTTNLLVSGGGKFQFLSVGSTPPSEVTTAAVIIGVNSASSDYLYLTDSSGARSNYVIGSRAGGTADGLNIWDASGDTLIATFSKQSVRFWQNVVGPVFDTGGSFTKTLNAAVYGVGSDSTESRIQAALDDTIASAASRVYVPANMQPYSASSISFINTIQMVREGGDQGRWDVIAYGADPKGVLSSTSAMQAAHNTGRQVYYPSGIYRFSTITGITSGGIVGDGPTKSILSSTDVGTANLITYTGTVVNIANSDSVALFRDFMIATPTASKTGGAAIRISPPTGFNTGNLHFDNIIVNNIPIGIEFVAGELWKIIGCAFKSYDSAGVKIANTFNPDSGDGVIVACEFNTPVTTGAGVLQHSGGGLRIIGSKFLGGLYGYQMNYDATADTSNLIIVGNSIELVQATGAGISLSRSSGTALFKNIVIANNQFGVERSGVSSDATNFLTELVITGNVMDLQGGGGFGVSLSGISDFVVAENVIRGASTGVRLNDCTRGRVGPNFYNGDVRISLTNVANVEQWDPIASTGTGLALSGGTLFAPTLWVSSGISALSSIVSSSYVSSSRTVMGGEFWGSTASIQNTDQSNTRLTLQNTGADGHNYGLISGLLNISNAGFSIADLTDGVIRLRIDNTTGRVSISEGLVASGATIRIAEAPTGGGLAGDAAGTAGDIAWGSSSGASFLYVCVSANSWMRATLNPF